MKRSHCLYIVLLITLSCTRVPVTNRVQLNLLAETELIKMAEKQYSDFLKSNRVISNNQAKMIQNCGLKISKAVETYLKAHKKDKRLKGFNWQINLVQDKTINAWCMPGGKIVFYTGIIDVCKDEAGIAVVMGHEIAHAIARHGNERMSKAIALEAGGQTLNQLDGGTASTLFKGAYGLGATLGQLAFSRKHEAEADRMGLIFMAMAGYDPREAPRFWKRMSEKGSKKPPMILSTHPHDEKRIKNLEKHMNEALKYYSGKKH